ncbi:MAG: PAS domain-containing sensor histidine kinase [Elusimicrobia bacterium]|nr:PAS domain-containing sensor histidine kinase [Elusimicrobiota bacterium]
MDKALPPPEAGLSVKGMAAAREFFKLLGQTAKLMGLYKPNHPVPAASLRETAKFLERLFTTPGLGRITFSLIDGRWLANGAFLADAEQISEVLLGVFRTHHIQSLSILPGALPFELSAICELAALPSHKAEGLDLTDALKQRGVYRVLLGVEHYARAVPDAHPAAASRVESPLHAPLPQGGSPAKKPELYASAGGFGALIKSLVETAVTNPEERAKIYADTVRMVREAMEHRVAEATESLKGEKQRVTFERERAERVFEAVADGRVVVDKDGRVMMMDHRAEEIIGKRLLEAAGKPLAESAAGEGRMVALSEGLRFDPDSPASLKVSVVGEGAADSMRKAMALVHDEEGRVVGALGELPSQTKARELEKLADEFVAGVTHELKAPLASIYSALELVSKTAAGKLSEQEQRFLSIGSRNVLKLRTMIDEILDFSKIQSGKMTVRAEPTALGVILSEGVESLRPWASSKNMTLALGPGLADCSSRKVMADHGRIVQVVTNLVSNAIKATPDGGAITVDAALGTGPDAGSIIVSVSDTGHGIAKEDLERIFVRFTQVVPKGRTREGVGLGLTIVRQIVGMHHGQMSVRSEVGKGSTFTFSLPLAVGG